MPLRTPVLSLLVLLLAPANRLQAQTPEQAYLDWVEIPLPASVYQQRRADVLAALGKGVLLVPSHHGVSDGFSFRQLDDFWYLTGLELPSSMLILDAEAGTSAVYVPERDARFASASRPNDFPGRPLLTDAELWRRAGLEARDASELDAVVARMVEAGREIVVNTGASGPVKAPDSGYFAEWSPAENLIHHLLATQPDIRLESAFEAVARVRNIKDEHEIATIRRVVQITVDAITEAAAYVRVGVTERDLEAELEAAYKRAGSQRLAFSSIIKSGPNSLWPWRILAAHHDRRNRVMHDGELVIFDVGTELDGYVSDIGRTFPVSGSFSDRQREILEMEIRVADTIIKAMRPGVTLAELTAQAYESIPEAHRPYMQTGVFFGHFIGMSTGDPALYDAPLEAGMVITVEPWYYNHDEDISVFTEDVVLVTAHGAEVLSAGLPRRPEELERMVGKR